MKPRKPMFSLDVLALALLTCLLASVVGMLVAGEDGKALQRRKLLHEKTVQITNGASEAQENQQRLVQQIEQSAEMARIEREQRIAQSQADELARKIEARRKIADAAAETIRLRDALAKSQDELDKTPGRRQIVGNYRGPYILIECVKGQALVYPGKTRLAKRPDQEAVQKLLERITQAGFVVFVVRPSGWYADSFDSLHELVFPAIANFEEASSRKIGRSIFALEANEPITPYLPPDHQEASPAQSGPDAPDVKSGQLSRS